MLLELPGVREVIGADTSTRSLDIARARYAPLCARFTSIDALSETGPVDLVFCNGVFHHVLPADRPGVVEQIWSALRPGGYFALWENNPWNPGTRYIMSRLPFDRDAVVVSAPQARKLLLDGGFAVQSVDFMFVFPAMLRRLRPYEPKLSRVPLGAQYQVLAYKAGD
jgi:SAM-dependent methyltransferase